jgi:hypothetical protein
MEERRRKWNERHKELRYALVKSCDKNAALDLFLIQHAMVHSGKLAKPESQSFQDELLTGLRPSSYRTIPAKGNHSIAWILWHLARIEDVTMNLLVADSPQVLLSKNWHERLRTKVINTGNGMSDAEVSELSKRIHVDALLEYRLAVTRRTRKIIKGLDAGEFNRKVESSSLQRIRNEHAVLPKANGIVEYWGKRTIAGLLLMPPTRHCFLHLNEALRIKSKIAPS